MVKIVVGCTVVWGETVKLLQAPLLVLKAGSLQLVPQEPMETMDSQDN